MSVFQICLFYFFCICTPLSGSDDFFYKFFSSCKGPATNPTRLLQWQNHIFVSMAYKSANGTTKKWTSIWFARWCPTVYTCLMTCQIIIRLRTFDLVGVYFISLKFLYFTLFYFFCINMQRQHWAFQLQNISSRPLFAKLLSKLTLFDYVFLPFL